MFSFFKKPIGIHLADQGVILARLHKDASSPALKDVFFEALPAGVIQDGVIIDAEQVKNALIRLRDLSGGSDCICSLPVSKSYGGVLRFPLGIEGEALEVGIKEHLQNVLPSPISDLYLEHSEVVDVENKERMVFVMGVELKLMKSYESLFKDAGWSVKFLLESLALTQAIPVDFSHFEAVMFVHSFGDGRFLVSSVYRGLSFDAYLAHDLEEDFQESFEAFEEQVGIAPTHVVISGEKDAAPSLAKIDFGEHKPQLVAAEFRVDFSGQELDVNSLIIATGLSLSSGLLRKNNGRSLLSLLD